MPFLSMILFVGQLKKANVVGSALHIKKLREADFNQSGLTLFLLSTIRSPSSSEYENLLQYIPVVTGIIPGLIAPLPLRSR